LYFAGWWTREVEDSRIALLESKLAKEPDSKKRKKLEDEIQKRKQKREEGTDLGEIDNEARHNFLFCVFSGAPREDIARFAEFNLVGLPELAPCAVQASAHLAARQKVVAARGEALIETGVATAPFTTGLGIEHPLENGFAFLDPYGVPYLPGSSVKGVLRRAAEELALFETDSQGWTVPAIWWLFGFDANSAYFVVNDNDPKPIGKERGRWREAFQKQTQGLIGEQRDLLDHYVDLACPKEKDAPNSPVDRVLRCLQPERKPADETRKIHTRGALEFWDVIPEPKDGKLRIDIMNPHYGHYYQPRQPPGGEVNRDFPLHPGYGHSCERGQPPGDWGSPVPIYFLTLPPGTTFTFIVRFRPPLNWPAPVRHYFEAEENGTPRWQRLVQAALEFAFDWLGFGAKTAVGYGRMSTSTLGAAAATFAAGKPGPANEQHPSSAHETRDAVQPEGPAAMPPELEQIGQLMQSLKNPATEGAQVERVVNELCRQRKHPAAAGLAAALWNKVKTVGWLASKVRKQTVFWELVQKGGGS